MKNRLAKSADKVIDDVFTTHAGDDSACLVGAGAAVFQHILNDIAWTQASRGGGGVNLGFGGIIHRMMIVMFRHRQLPFPISDFFMANIRLLIPQFQRLKKKLRNFIASKQLFTLRCKNAY